MITHIVRVISRIIQSIMWNFIKLAIWFYIAYMYRNMETSLQLARKVSLLE